MNMFILMLCIKHKSICFIDFDIRIFGISLVLQQVLEDKNKFLDVFLYVCLSLFLYCA